MSRITFKSLLSMGVLNGEAPSLEELCYPVKASYKGFCTSHKCTSVQVPYTTKRGKTGHRIKRVGKRFVSDNQRDTACPHCGSTILWKKQKEK